MLSFKNVIFLLLILCLTWLVYSPIAGSAFVSDVTGWFLAYERDGWNGVIHSFGDKSLHHCYHLATFLLYKVSPHASLVWKLAFVFFHGLNAWLLWLFTNNLLRSFHYKNASIAATFAAFLFLFNPYHPEAVSWAATLHYLLATALILFILYILVSKKLGASTLLIIHTAFFVALFTLEIALSVPFFTVVLLFAPSSTFKTSKSTLFSKVLLPQMFFVVVYFILNKVILGSWIGHYGAEKHLNLPITFLASNYAKYFCKHFAFSQFWSYPLKEKLYVFLEQKRIARLLLVAYIVFPSIAFLFKSRLPKKVGAISVSILLFMFSLAPVISLFFTYLVLNEGDRMSYLAGAFASLTFVAILFSFHRYVAIALCCLLLFFSADFLKQNIHSWKGAIAISKGLVSSFKCDAQKEIYLLTLADNLSGAYIARSFAGNQNFRDLLNIHHKGCRSKIYEVLNFNMNHLSDCTKVEVLSQQQFRISFAQEGNWFWYNGIGASSYETEMYKVDIDQWNASYIFSFKGNVDNAMFMYQCGDKLLKVDF